MNKFWQNTFVVLIFCVLAFSSVFFVACGERNYSKQDISAVYSAILDDYCDNNGYIKISIDADKVIQEEVLSDDKYYIFPYILDNFVQYSSGVVFSVAHRQNGITYSLSKFSQKQLNDIYQKLSSVNAKLKNVDDIKKIYEKSDGYLRYNDLVNAYFDLIDGLYALSGSFSDYYIKPLYNSSFSQTDVAKGALSDIFWYELFSLSKVSYVYDFKNYTADETSGFVATWFGETDLLGQFMNDTADILSTLLSNGDLSYNLSTQNKTRLAEVVTNLIEFRGVFERDFNNFEGIIGTLDFKNYLNSASRESYLQNCPDITRSKFELIDRFIIGIYESFMGGIRVSATNMNV